MNTPTGFAVVDKIWIGPDRITNRITDQIRDRIKDRIMSTEMEKGKREVCIISSVSWEKLDVFHIPFFWTFFITILKMIYLFHFGKLFFFYRSVICWKNFQRGLSSIMSRRLYFGLSRKISDFIWPFMSHEPWSDPWSGLWSDPWSDPVRSRFCRRRCCHNRSRFVPIDTSARSIF